jgi:hypothetical protein
MAADAVRRQPLELAYSGVLVTAVAFQHGMRSHQGKAIKVLLDGLHPDAPAFHRVAAFAASAELAAVNVGVAVRAFGARIGEHQVGVALAAGYSFVHTPQRKAGFIVIKLGKTANRFPSGESMAVLTRQI